MYFFSSFFIGFRGQYTTQTKKIKWEIQKMARYSVTVRIYPYNKLAGNCCTLIEYGFVRIKTEEIQLLSDRPDSSDKSD